MVHVWLFCEFVLDTVYKGGVNSVVHLGLLLCEQTLFADTRASGIYLGLESPRLERCEVPQGPLFPSGSFTFN